MRGSAGRMQLKVQSENVRNVAVLRCQGRIITGDEVRSLQQEVEKQTLGTKKVILNLAEVNFIDSGGLGALVRLCRVLRNARGDLILCHLSPFFSKVLHATTLHQFFRICPSEGEALESFALRSVSQAETVSTEPRTRVVCVDTSTDLLAFIGALLKHSGYDIFVTSNLADARTLVIATGPSIIICGPSIAVKASAFDRIRQINPQIPFLQLPADFSFVEGSQTGAELLDRIQSLLKSAHAQGGHAPA